MIVKLFIFTYSIIYYTFNFYFILTYNFLYLEILNFFQCFSKLFLNIINLIML